MDRKQQLFEYVGKDENLLPVIDNVLYLEDVLKDLQTKPKIKYHPTDPTKQKLLPAAKLYKEYMQQYLNCIKILLRAAGKDGTDEESPLREYFRSLQESLQEKC